MKISGWEYKVDRKKGFQVIHNKKANPNVLSKYYGISNNSVDALLKSYIYAPTSFSA